MVGLLNGRDERGAHLRIGEVGVRYGSRFEHRPAHQASVGDALECVAGTDRTQHGSGDLGVRQQLGHRASEIAANLLEGLVAFVRLDALAGHQDVLRRRAHLTAVQRERERHVAQHGGVLVGGINDHRVDPGHLGIEPSLSSVLMQPSSEVVAAGEVDAGYRRMGREGLRVFRLVADGQRYNVRVESLFSQHVTQDADRQCHR